MYVNRLSANKIYINEIPARILINWRLEQGGVFDPIYWFLPCLFMTQLILYFILKIFKTRNIQVFLLILLVVIAYIYEYLFDWILPWEIDLLPMSCFYVMFGFLIKRYLFHKINKLGTISGAIVGGVILVLGSNLGFVHKNIIGYIPDMNSTRYGLIILNITAAILCSVGIILLCRVIHSGLMNYIGQNSLLFYLAQPLVYKITDLMLCIVLPFYSYAGNSFNLILLHVGTNVAILIYVYLYKKLKETSKMKVKRLRESIL